MTPHLRNATRVGIIVIASMVSLPMMSVAEEPLTFVSTELNPVQEANAMRNDILKDFAGSVDFQPHDNRALFSRMVSGVDGETPDIVGSLHGDFVPLAKAGQLKSMAAIMSRLGERHINREFVNLASFGGDTPRYIPWMQATYVMAANRRALKFLPKGADVNSLTYAQLTAWGENMKRATGHGKIGFPAGEGGLMHRFLQGYILPSYTGGVVNGFASDDAKTMWQDFRTLWDTVSTRSLTFNRMDAPLLSEEVWVAWDHTARLLDAVRERPDEFVVFPAPAGPKGRGFMVVLAGLAIPTSAVDSAQVEALISYLTRPDIQAKTLEIAGFFPVIEDADTTNLPTGLALLNDGVAKQASAADALPNLLPIGLRAHSGDFNTLYLSTFSRIVLRGKNIDATLLVQAAALDALMTEANAPCWAPDPPSQGPCRTKRTNN